jgi:diguanylate cyclase (GGDEF)-like protein
MPRFARPIGIAYLVVWLYCAAIRVISPRLPSVNMARVVVFVSYTFVSMVASWILHISGPHSELSYSGHIHIMLSVLLLPLALWESAIIGAMVNLSLSWAAASNLAQSDRYTSHLLVLLTITLFGLIIAHMQDTLRRRAFDAAYDVMRSAARLQALTFMDALTGGFNRRYLDRILRGEIARAIRFDRPLSVVMFDLDNFKRVNDSRGHSAGDDVLREVWQAAHTTIREVDTIARYGGDEFSLVLPETDEESAHAVAERLQMAARDRLEARFGQGSIESQVTLSIGITTVRPVESIHPDKVLDSADERLYEAKRCGKNSIAA